MSKDTYQKALMHENTLKNLNESTIEYFISIHCKCFWELSGLRESWVKPYRGFVVVNLSGLKYWKFNTCTALKEVFHRK